MCKRRAIQSNVITVSARNRPAIFTLSASVLRRFLKPASAHRRLANSSATRRSAFAAEEAPVNTLLYNSRD